jgi:hypothetical protein
VDSILPSPRHRLLDLERDGSGCRFGRGAAREGSRAAHPKRGEEPRTEAELQREVGRRDEQRRMSGGERAAALEGIPIGIGHARRGRGTCAAWWAGPVHFLLLLSFSFSFSFLFIIYYSKLLF